ncbi:MAG: hypothetical protein [Siphoviridae sp. ctpQM7]|nr:MAG: hypothetical protein [Siphoviridae sp. ctpQM7]
MLESSARLYNRNVTRMQLEFRALFQRLIEQTKKQTEEYILDHKNCDREEVVELANAYLRKQREQMLEHLRLAIEKEREERQRRDAKMRQFCEESSPVNS